jgi:hypothetical protein
VAIDRLADDGRHGAVLSLGDPGDPGVALLVKEELEASV